MNSRYLLIDQNYPGGSAFVIAYSALVTSETHIVN